VKQLPLLAALSLAGCVPPPPGRTCSGLLTFLAWRRWRCAIPRRAARVSLAVAYRASGACPRRARCCRRWWPTARTTRARAAARADAGGGRGLGGRAQLVPALRLARAAGRAATHHRAAAAVRAAAGAAGGGARVAGGRGGAGVHAGRSASVAVFPFVLQARDTTLRPLSRALAELLVTDLAHDGPPAGAGAGAGAAAADEIRARPERTHRSGHGRAQRPAAARGRLVQGSIEGDVARLRLGAVVWLRDATRSPGRHRSARRPRSRSCSTWRSGWRCRSTALWASS